METQCTGQFDARTIDFQQVLSNPILDIAAQVWEGNRYAAFKACYKSMRLIDDLVDDRKIAGGLTEGEKQLLVSRVNSWLYSLENNGSDESMQGSLLGVMSEFKIPLWPWIELSKAMIYDLRNDGFKTFNDFLDYSEGACVAPGAIFMHLCGIKRGSNGFEEPRFNVREAARPIALFSYLVHVVRDFQKDQLNNLNYFAGDLMEKHGLSAFDLREAARLGKASDELRGLMRDYYDFAGRYRIEARESLDKIRGHLGSRYQLSLELILGLYSQIFERIDVDNGSFTELELNPSPAQVNKRITRIVSSFNSNL
jgi:phytoene/squalene synthetase